MTTRLSEATAPDVTYAIATTSASVPATGITTSTSGITNVSDAHSGASQDGGEWSGRLATRLITRLFARPLQRQQGERQLLRPERHLLQAQRRALAAQRRLRSQHCGVALIAA